MEYLETTRYPDKSMARLHGKKGNALPENKSCRSCFGKILLVIARELMKPDLDELL
jgi:hypothetical protein